MRFGKAGLLVVTIALLTGSPAASQSATREVTGIVSDKRGNALPAAVVQLENTVDLTEI